MKLMFYIALLIHIVLTTSWINEHVEMPFWVKLGLGFGVGVAIVLVTNEARATHLRHATAKTKTEK